MISTVNHYRFIQKSEPYHYNIKHRFPLLFLTANRTVTKTKAFSIFNFNSEPYRCQITVRYGLRLNTERENGVFFAIVR